MNRKTIESIFSKKIEDWVSSISDLELAEKIRNNCIITGGAIVSLLLNEKPKDYDIYFKDKNILKLVAQYYINKFLEKHPEKNIYLIDCSEQIEENKKKILDESKFENEEKKNEKLKEIDVFLYHLQKMDPDRVRIMIPSKGIAEENSELTKNPSSDIIEAMEELDSINENILDEIDSKKEDLQEKEKYKPVFFSSNAITLSNHIQIVVRFYGEPSKIHENYDFVHCTNYWTKEGELVLNENALECILTKQLKYIGSKYPLCSVIRTRKFIKRGWNINAGQYLKMLFQTSQLNLTDIWVLEDQLIGVDSSYFDMLIDAIKSKLETESNFILTNDYLATIIDRIF